MKKIIVLAIAIIFITAIQAQNVFDKGSIMFNGGIGAPMTDGAIPTINFSGEIGVIPTGSVGVVSFGGLAEFQIANYDWFDDNEVFPRFYIGPRATWHVTALRSDVFDAYAGTGFGISISGKTDNFDSDVNFDADFFVGGRWMFKPSLGLFAEVGYSGLSALKFGLTFGL
jgi:hypothetical protein